MAQHSFNFNTEPSKMAEAQKMCDREMHGINSTNDYPNYKNKDRIHKIKYLKDIPNLEHYGPAGLIHIIILSNIIQRPIKIWNANGNLNKIIGKKKMRLPVNIEYHVFDSEGIGHWTLRGGKDPDNIIIDLNSCLFSVIGSQIGQDPLRLRKWTMLKLKNNFQNLVEWIDKILQSEENLMIGGARYRGTCYDDAGKILDKSQNQICHETRPSRLEHIPGHAVHVQTCEEGRVRNPPRGHPRGHASNPSNPFSIEEYSKKGKKKEKTGFLSRADQDYVTHLALKTPIAEDAMNRLNNSKIDEKIDVPADELIHPDRDLPKAKVWVNGRERASSEANFTKVRLVLRHHDCKVGNPDEDVFVQTCFPII